MNFTAKNEYAVITFLFPHTAKEINMATKTKRPRLSEYNEICKKLIIYHKIYDYQFIYNASKIITIFLCLEWFTPLVLIKIYYGFIHIHKFYTNIKAIELSKLHSYHTNLLM